MKNLFLAKTQRRKESMNLIKNDYMQKIARKQ